MVKQKKTRKNFNELRDEVSRPKINKKNRKKLYKIEEKNNIFRSEEEKTQQHLAEKELKKKNPQKNESFQIRRRKD